MKKILALIFTLGLMSSVFAQNTTTPVTTTAPSEVKKEEVKKEP